MGLFLFIFRNIILGMLGITISIIIYWWLYSKKKHDTKLNYIVFLIPLLIFLSSLILLIFFPYPSPSDSFFSH